MNGPEDTIAAIATPTGKGGIGIVRVSGPASKQIASQICHTEPVPRQVMYCTFRDKNKETIDKGVLLYFSSPASYTGEDVVEFQGHGSRASLEALLQECVRNGARLARPGEFTERAYHNNRIDLLQAEAVADLINSQSVESARSAVRSLEGEFSESINQLVEQIDQLRLFTESALDFPEEEIDFIKESDLGSKIEGVVSSTLSILQSARQGRVMHEGCSLAILGEPNVGKSSLLNCLSQAERAIVSNQAGTTRDVLEDNILINGLPIRIVDTAGIRSTGNEIEREGIARAVKAAESADLVLHVHDAENISGEGVRERLPGEVNVLDVINKIDLLDDDDQTQVTRDKADAVLISAKTGEGLEQLRKKIFLLLNPHSSERTLPGRTRHLEALEKTVVELEQALKQSRGTSPAAELIAEDLLRAQQSAA